MNRRMTLLLPLALLSFLIPAKAETAPQPAAEADGRHDFDFFIGSWTIKNRRLKPGSKNDWSEFTSTTTDKSFLAGLGNMDKMTLPHDTRGVSLRFFDPAKKEWSIYWANSGKGQLELPPLVGKFENGVGRFYSDDVDENKKPVKIRYTWTHASAESPHWDLAYSYDEGKTWEVKWTMEFARR